MDICLVAIASASSLSAVFTSNFPLGYNVKSASPVKVHTILDWTPASKPLSIIFAPTCSKSMDVTPSGTICHEDWLPHSSIANPSLMQQPQISGFFSWPEGPVGGPEGGPLGGPEGGPDGGPVGGPDGGPLGEPDGGPLGGPEGGPLGGPDGGPDGNGGGVAFV